MFLLATDLDRTLFPNGSYPNDGSIEVVSRLHDKSLFKLAYVTGRDIELMKQGMEEHGAPMPDYAITDVGSNIYIYKENHFELLEEWISHIRKSSPDWNLEEMESKIANLEITKQPDKNQTDFKLSYWFKDDNMANEVIKRLKDIAKVIVSHDGDDGLIDIVPKCATKKGAIDFLTRKLSLSDDKVICFGDSGNDIDWLSGKHYAVAVRNMEEYIFDEILKRSPDLDKLYKSKGDYGNGYYASGIIEGLLHFEFIDQKDL